MRTIAEAGAALRSGDLTSEGLVEECLAAIEARNAELNAFVHVRADAARAEAREADAELARGADHGPLHGIPVSLKDVIDVEGEATTAATAARAGHRASWDADVTMSLRAAGAVLIGKCNLHELAFGATGAVSAFGPARNPHDPQRIAGGSSSGSAISVAAGMALASVGTDTGGSVRIPASACGVVGLKPTHGEVSTEGVVPLAPTLDHVGPMAADVAGAAALYHVLCGANRPGHPAHLLPPPLLPARPLLGVLRRYFLDLLEPEVAEAFDAAVERLTQAGCRITDVDVLHAPDTGPVYVTTQLPEASAQHAELLDRAGGRNEDEPDADGPNADGLKEDGLDAEVRQRLERGRSVLAEDYVRAQQKRAVLTLQVDGALDIHYCEALLLPALAIVPPPLGAETVTIGDASHPLRPLTLRLTQLFNLTGHPAIAIPCGRAGGLPTALQLVGRRDDTRTLLALAEKYEEAIRG